jgi:hypothetical protein
MTADHPSTEGARGTGSPRELFGSRRNTWTRSWLRTPLTLLRPYAENRDAIRGFKGRRHHVSRS